MISYFLFFVFPDPYSSVTKFLSFRSPFPVLSVQKMIALTLLSSGVYADYQVLVFLSVVPEK